MFRAVVLGALVVAACGSEPIEGDGIPESQSAKRAAAEETPILFRSQVGDGPGELYVMTAEGTGLRRVARDGNYSVPEWSPDGGTIAFRNDATGSNADVGIVTLDGSSPITLSEAPGGRSWNLPIHWLPDRQELAYAAWPSLDVMHLWAVSRFGGAPRRLLGEIEGNHETATWSPRDGSTIAYTEYSGQRTLDVWVVSALEGAEPVNLTQGRVYSPRFPAWSPDGSRILFNGFALLEDGTIEGLSAHGSGGGGLPDAEIFLVDVETQELTRVTDNEWDDTTPTWAPDGEHVLIASLRGGDTDLWLMPLDDPEQARNLIDDDAAPREDVMPHWYRPRP